MFDSHAFSLQHALRPAKEGRLLALIVRYYETHDYNYRIAKKENVCRHFLMDNKVFANQLQISTASVMRYMKILIQRGIISKLTRQKTCSSWGPRRFGKGDKVRERKDYTMNLPITGTKQQYLIILCEKLLITMGIFVDKVVDNVNLAYKKVIKFSQKSRSVIINTTLKKYYIYIIKKWKSASSQRFKNDTGLHFQSKTTQGCISNQYRKDGDGPRLRSCDILGGKPRHISEIISKIFKP